MKIFLICICSVIVSATFSQTTSPSVEAKKVAQKTVTAMGGMQNFNNTNYIGWNFFGYRQLIWDKVHNRVRIDYFKKNYSVILSLNKNETKLFMHSEEVTHVDSLKKYLHKGRSLWMNDSYWLVMPFKLFDAGVNLKYEGIKKTIDSTDAHVLELTFDQVGETPENKYYVYIDTKNFYVTQWDFYDVNGHLSPTLSTTWGDYKKYGKIMLSSNRGTSGKLSDIHVWESLPEKVFTEATVPVFSEL